MKKSKFSLMRVLGITCCWFLVFILFGCSVKENRDECPCQLVLDFAASDSLAPGPFNVAVLSEAGLIHSGNISNIDEDYVINVPKGMLNVNVWQGDSDLCIPYGSECPSVYMHAFEADTRCEMLVKDVDLRKNHCCLTVMVEGYEKIPYSLTLYGNVDGYDLDGKPSEGAFSCVAYPDDSAGAQAQLPRQNDNSLMLEVDDGNFLTRRFALGEYLAASGYDWSAESLPDVTIILDYYVTRVKIIVRDWENEYTYNVIL